MTIFYFMSIIAIISDFSFQIPTSEKSLKLVYVLSVLSGHVFYLLWQKKLSYVFIHLFRDKNPHSDKHTQDILELLHYTSTRR